MDASAISTTFMWNCHLLLLFNLSLVLVIFTNEVSAEEYLKSSQITVSLHGAVGAGNIRGSVTKVRSSALGKDGNFPDGNQFLPIKRIRNSDFLKVKSKYHKSTLGEVPEGPHQYAVLKMPKGEYLGAQAAFSVWKPRLSSSLQVSIAQVWLVSTHSSLPINTIEAGWMVHPNLYGDWEPHFFTFYTNDSYQTDCFNNMCGTFTQVSSKIIPGTKVAPLSDMDGGQTEIFLNIRKNSTSGDWWLYFGENMQEAVGYWAKDVFSSLRDHAESIEWGGETSSGGTSSYPGMGSGWFAEYGYGRAAFVRTMKYVDAHFQEHDAPSPLDHVVTNELCYTIDDRGTDFFGRHFLYGGPGGEC